MGCAPHHAHQVDGVFVADGVVDEQHVGAVVVEEGDEIAGVFAGHYHHAGLAKVFFDLGSGLVVGAEHVNVYGQLGGRAKPPGGLDHAADLHGLRQIRLDPSARGLEACPQSTRPVHDYRALEGGAQLLHRGELAVGDDDRRGASEQKAGPHLVGALHAHQHLGEARGGGEDGRVTGGLDDADDRPDALFPRAALIEGGRELCQGMPSCTLPHAGGGLVGGEGDLVEAE